MSVLAINTASRSRVVCVMASPQGQIVDSTVILGQPVGSALPPAIARMLDVGVTAVVVVTGPGTYTGVRAGMAAALGVAHARSVPLHGLGSLEVVACAGSTAGSEFWVVSDAGRGALYVARSGDAATPRRVALTAFEPGAEPVFAADPVPVPGTIVVEPAQALARAVPLALSRVPLTLDGLVATYVD